MGFGFWVLGFGFLLLSYCLLGGWPGGHRPPYKIPWPYRLSGGLCPPPYSAPYLLAWLYPGAWHEEGALKKGEGAENQVKVVTKGNQATIFINGKEVVSFPGQPPEGGSLIGFAGSSGAAGQNSVAFSNVQVVQP